MLCMCMCMCMRVHMVAQCMCMCMCAQTCMHAHMHIEIRIDVVSQTCELSGVSSDSQFCETKKVKAPLGVRVVRLSVDTAQDRRPRRGLAATPHSFWERAEWFEARPLVWRASQSRTSPTKVASVWLASRGTTKVAPTFLHASPRELLQHA